MLGLANSNDPTPPIGLARGGAWSVIMIVIGAAHVVYGVIRIASDLGMGLVFLLDGIGFVALGVARVVVSRRPAPGSDGGTADRP